MSERELMGTVIGSFTYHATIAMPDGRSFQVPNSALEDGGNNAFVLRPDAKIEHVFPTPKYGNGPSVAVPVVVLDRLLSWH